MMLSVFYFTPGFSEHLGTYGHVFEIVEEDLLQVMEKRLQALIPDKMQSLQQQMIQRTRQKLQTPPPVAGVCKTQSPRVWRHDPSIALSQNLQDLKGRVFYEAGTSLNPLTLRNLSHTLLFFDSRDSEQVVWAQKFSSHPPTIWILVGGSPFKLMEQTQRVVYFDQTGSLTQKLGITHVPASVQQEGLKLRIEEHLIPSTEGDKQ